MKIRNFIIIFIMSVFLGFQPASAYRFGQEFTLQIDNSATFMFESIYDNGFDYLVREVISKDGITFMHQITTNSTIKVTYENINSSLVTQVEPPGTYRENYLWFRYEIDGYYTYERKTVSLIDLLLNSSYDNKISYSIDIASYSYPNQAAVDDYVDSRNSRKRTIYPIDTYNRTGDLIFRTIKESNSLFNWSAIKAFNWKTGWYQYIEYNSYNKNNGSLRTSFLIKGTPETVANQNPIIITSVIIIAFVSGAYLATVYKKRSVNLP